jgi:hypothetical protein
MSPVSQGLFMSLSAGTRFGTFEIVSLLGVGAPTSARAEAWRELRRGLAEAQGTTTW